MWLLGKVYDGEEDDARIADLCEKALKLLREASMSYFMVPVMETITERYARLGYKEAYNEWKTFLNMLKETEEETQRRLMERLDEMDWQGFKLWEMDNSCEMD